MELRNIKGVGEKTLDKLKQLNIMNTRDLLYFFPKAYDIYEIDNNRLFSKEMICIEGIIDSKPAFIKYRKNISTIIFYLSINQIRLKCIVFSQDYLRFKLIKGNKIVLYGHYNEENKEFLVRSVFLNAFSTKIAVDYKIKDIPSTTFNRIVQNALLEESSITETLPIELLEKYRLYPIVQYITASHFPKNKIDLIQINRRRKYEEFFWYAISLEVLKLYRKNNIKKPRVIDQDIICQFIDNLPYQLTEDQSKAVEVIKEDIAAVYPMNRLLQGDVGCGKSIVAIIAALMEIKSDFQVVVMVPTEILAVQHFAIFSKCLEPYGINTALLVSDIKKSEKEDILYRLIHHRIHLIIGTHALLEDSVVFHRLGLVIIDEQHRFGVNQRQKLVKKYEDVDCLYLTATPIPRTLGLTEFGDLDISSIHTKPNNRIPVKTHIVQDKDFRRLLSSLKTRLSNHEQMYVVVPIIEENKEFADFDLSSTLQILKEVLVDETIGIVNGKRDPKEKNKTMMDFKQGRTRVLLSTTVIEVGVDVPQATIMIILDANHFGLAQIHQLRGRVGRGNLQSDCYLVSKDVSNPRLLVLKDITDGFEIAVEDFKLRGPGNYLGDEQSGYVGLQYSDFTSDLKIWTCAKEDSKEYCQKFLSKNKENNRFMALLSKIEQQKGKIN